MAVSGAPLFCTQHQEDLACRPLSTRLGPMEVQVPEFSLAAAHLTSRPAGTFRHLNEIEEESQRLRMRMLEGPVACLARPTPEGPLLADRHRYVYY
jgi:hypothetical protein